MIQVPSRYSTQENSITFLFFSFFFPPSKRGFLETELEFPLTQEESGNGREETGAVLMGRRAVREGCLSAARQLCRLCCIPRVQVL